MKRRGLTVLVGCLLLALLAGQIGWVRVPYVTLGPGPTIDALGRSDGQPVISVQGAPATKSAGQLRLVTVSVQSDLTIADALKSWWDDDQAVVPRELVYPPDKSEKQVNEDNDREFQQSQSSAETAALRKLGYPVEVVVTEVSREFPAAEILAAGDVILAVDGIPVTSPARLAELVRANQPGIARQITYKREGVENTVDVKTGKGDEDTARLGVSIEQRQPHPFQLDIQLDRIGGPSAGLMFALGIVDVIQPEDLTGGLVIAGTGTIDEDGEVGPIGGIHQKLIAAKAAGAKSFLTPADNCQDALANRQPGLQLVKVASLDEALDALKALREHRTPTLCER
jgi:PDZ domain-containing protein